MAKDERWRRALYMQVERADELNQQIHFGDDVGNASGGWVSNTWGTCPIVWDTTWKQVLIPEGGVSCRYGMAPRCIS